MNTLKNILDKISIEEGCKRLTKREKKIISLYYLEGYSDEEIAAFYRVSRQTINESRKRGIRKLKNI